MDWFERLTGFREAGYEETRRRLNVVDGRLHADGYDRGLGVGALNLPSAPTARADERPPSNRPAAAVHRRGRRARDACVAGNAGALFQVASQFNMLEMVAPNVTLEEGVTRYQHDRTQGPACAMAAGAATIYRNYLVPLGGDTGQTATRQLDGLADVGSALAQRLGSTVPAPWIMRNGYAMATREGLKSVDAVLREADAELLDDLRGRLRFGLHEDVEVTDQAVSGPTVSQVFCSALPVAYAGHPPSAWARSARLVLHAPGKSLHG